MIAGPVTSSDFEGSIPLNEDYSPALLAQHIMQISPQKHLDEEFL